MVLQILDTGTSTADANMACDAELLHNLAANPMPILHLYDWASDSLTYGYFVNPAEHLNLSALNKWKLSTAKRPTGGGLLFHTCDLAFSFVLPASHSSFSNNTLTNYATVNTAVLQAIQPLQKSCQPLTLLPQQPPATDQSSQRFCMAHPTKFDIMLDGRKVGGAAQRRTKNGLLHQGSICLTSVPQDCLADVLLSGTQVAQSMHATSYPLLGPDASQQAVVSARQELRQLLMQSFKERF